MNYGGNQFFRDLVANGASQGSDVTTGFGWVQFSDPNHVLVTPPTSNANRCWNPTAKTYQDFWFTAAGTTVTQPAETGFSRPTGLHVVVGGSAGVASDPNINLPVAPASVGETWSIYVEAKGTITPGNTTTCWLNFTDANGSFLTPNPSQNVTLSSTAQAIQFSGYTAPANTAFVGMSIEGTATSGDTFDVACAYYDIVSSITSYNDGDSTGWSWDNGLTDGDSPSRQANTPNSITGDTPSAQRAAGPTGSGFSVALAGDTPAAQRSSGPDGVLVIATILTDTPTAARQSGPDGSLAIGVTLTDSPSAERDYGPDGTASLGVSLGPDMPSAVRFYGPDGLVAVDLSITDRPSGVRCAGPVGSVALGLALTDSPSAGRYYGPDGSVDAAAAGGVALTDSPTGSRYCGPDGLLALGIVVAGDAASGTRFAGPDGGLAIDIVLSDTPSAERDGGPAGLVVAILSDSPTGVRYYGPDGSMGIDLPLAASSPSAARYLGPAGLISIGVGADVIAGTASPAGARYSGPVGEVLLAILPSKPPYIPVSPLVAPSYALWVADTRTGRMMWELPMETTSWSSKLNDVGTIQADLSVENTWDTLSDQDERDPRIMLREILSGPWRFSLVLKWGNNVVWAGPYLGVARPVPSKITVNGAEIGKIFTKRPLIAPGAISAVDPTADTTFGPNATKPHVAAALVNQAMVGVGYNLPITVVDPGGSGLDARIYYGYELANTWDKLKALMTEADGPEIRFDPRIAAGADGDYLTWVMQIGNPHLGRNTTAWVFDSDVNSIIGLNGDGSNMAFGVWTPGSGQSRDRLIAHSQDASLLNIGWPMLEEVDNSNTSEISYPILLTKSNAALTAYKQPVVAFQTAVPADSDPMVGTYRVGEDFSIDVRNDPIVPDGLYTRRIAGLSGTEKPWVTITDTNPLPVGSL
jgi:hypothetical protein